MGKSGKVHIFVTFLLITFFLYIFKNFFNQRETLRFLIPFLLKIFFYVILVLFSIFEAKRAKNGSKKRKTLFL
jgi:hypothetical protein